jgi:hypothetical protein
VYVWLRDSLGNTMAAPASATTSLAYVLVALQGGANATASPTVSVSVVAAGAAKMCVTDRGPAGCPAAARGKWKRYSPTARVRLSGPGNRTILAYVRSSDAAPPAGPGAAWVVYLRKAGRPGR